MFLILEKVPKKLITVLHPPVPRQPNTLAAFRSSYQSRVTVYHCPQFDSLLRGWWGGGSYGLVVYQYDLDD
jgi:hypothetical protein